MKHFPCLLLLFLNSVFCFVTKAQENANNYPQAQISNEQIVMKLYLPDQSNGYYQATRFDWSGVIYSLEFEGHQYFGEWKTTHDPLVHEDITGPVESFGAGLGYDEAKVGGEFMRIGIGLLEKQKDAPYVWNQTYKIFDHGEWKVNIGKDWIEFQHQLNSKAGWGYIYTKRIALMKEKPGFSIEHILENTGLKTIETDQFNHNFFVIDGDTTGPDFRVEFPFNITSADGLQDRQKAAKIEKKQLLFNKMLSRGSVWMDLKGFGSEVTDHQFKIVNEKTGAGVQLNGDKPLHRLVFWATTKTLCPENYVYLNIEPGNSESWTSEYTLFTK
ncbi:MAG: hypothetical protein HQ541_10895 [Mariniphaga sp.]|nr:hypothetical protein [Mariniphaga sp.]